MIYFLSLGDIETASSRLRVHLLAPYLNAQIGVPEHYDPGDVLIIQKVHAPDELLKAKSQGAKVIFDIDDYYWYRRAYEWMLENADLVTVDTESKAKELTNYKVKVVPDCLDWDGTIASDSIRDLVGWTGHGNNAEYLNAVGKEIAKRYTWRLVTSEDVDEYADFHYTFRKWSIDTVDRDLSECEMTAYYMPDETVGKMKGMHKVLKSWAIGLPCYTSRIPDYMKAMEEAGVGERYLVDDWSRLHNIGFDERCREYALRYNPAKISELWKEAIGVALNESGA